MHVLRGCNTRRSEIREERRGGKAESGRVKEVGAEGRDGVHWHGGWMAESQNQWELRGE